MAQFIRWFDELSLDDVALVGGKNASLGEMYRNLESSGVAVPYGFAVTAKAYEEVLSANNAWEKLAEALEGLDTNDAHMLRERTAVCRDIVGSVTLPGALVDELQTGYETLRERYGSDITLAVRSSATAEDSPEASFAGQNESYLNIATFDELRESYIACLASNFTERSIHYKHLNGFDPLKVSLSVVVMKMVRSDISSSGVMFSIDPITGFRDVVFINASYGLGENIVQGTVDPDSFYVHKPTRIKGYDSILQSEKGSKLTSMVYAPGSQKHIVSVPTTEAERKRFAISDEDVLTLADYAISIEEHYSSKYGRAQAMDIEWARDGIDGKLYIVQARPETVHSRARKDILETYRIKEYSTLLATGQSVGQKIGKGKICKLRSADELEKFEEGGILLARVTTPDWEPIMKKASAIITQSGGRTCHAAIISRELGIPAIVGIGEAFEHLNDAQEVTVSCAEGEAGHIYEGLLDYEVVTTDLGALPEIKTHIMMNLGNPEMAFSLASLPVQGIGLARMEFIITSSIRAHPMALLYPEKCDSAAQQTIAELTEGYGSNSEFFIRTLSQGAATIASAVYPHPCVMRMSDFKSNEYASLLGGAPFEVHEENPMIGFRGASRYAHPAYEEGFALECAAMKRVRDEMGMTNIILMIPFCRRVEEARKVVETMEKYGLKRGENGLQVYMMCEIPNNILEMDGFSHYFDGFSIGSNDLTQLTLGVDRDSEIVAFDYDERDSGVQKFIQMAIEGAKRNDRHIGICGQAPSDYPEIAKRLIELGIDSISLNPDSVLGTIDMISKLEGDRS